MEGMIVQSKTGVTLVGAGAVAPDMLARALDLAPLAVAADGGADTLLAAGIKPEAVIGDLDSLSTQARAHIPAGRLHRIAEQETTDFDKALRSVAAPFVLALGVTGARLDHTLEIGNLLLHNADRRCIVIGQEDICFLAPVLLELVLASGSRISLLPLREVRGASEGLNWPLDGIAFAPGAMSGISNRATTGPVRLRFSDPHMLVVLPHQALEAAIAGLMAAGD